MVSSLVRTRFAPSPTGFLHLGGARTALFCWAFARRHRGNFILRIEDTDLARSTSAAIQGILDGLKWLGLSWDEGPFFQTQRFDRYRSAAHSLLSRGLAYHCYCSHEEVEAMREAQRARGEKPRYDGRWRPEVGKSLPSIPSGVSPVIRFKTPQEGAVGWEDGVKGHISISNSELDDLIILRSDGSPTYNFCVSVDDFDMQISHVIRGDDHVNNTPRQIHILQGLGAPIPIYAHLPMILGNDGEKLSKRHGAVSVMEYAADYLPEAMMNYLSRLGFGHGNDEIFSPAQFCQWFQLNQLSHAPAQFDSTKLNWLNAHYLQITPAQQLIERLPGLPQADNLAAVIDLMKLRCSTLSALRQAVEMFYAPHALDPATVAPFFNQMVLTAVHQYQNALSQLKEWNTVTIAALMKETLKQHGLKMPQLAMPLRLLLLGATQTPSIDQVQEVLGQRQVYERIAARLPVVAQLP